MINGIAINALTGAPAAHVPFTLYRNSTGFLSVKRKVIDFEADDRGQIESSASIDTSILKGVYFFSAEVSDNPDWIMPLDYQNRMYNVTSSPFSHYEPKVYPRGNLTLELKRSIPGNFTNFSVLSHFSQSDYVTIWNAAKPQDLTETSKKVLTAAGVWTYLDITRTDAQGNNLIRRDSIFLQPGQPRTVTITY
jgi:hypothetical protein